jgi:zinc transport system ATP-binding protein
MICVENLQFSYSGQRPYLLEGLDFEVEAGSFVSIVGGNGTGKSTLVRLILGLLAPLGGSVALTSARKGYVPQSGDFAETRFPITVNEVLDSYRRIVGVRDKQQTDAVLEAVGLAHVKEQRIGELSGGQRQKVFLARALLGEPALLVLDEPSSGIDPRSRTEIYAYLRFLNSKKGMTILSVEHNLAAAVQNSTKLFHLQEGRGHYCDPATYLEEYETSVLEDRS